MRSLTIPKSFRLNYHRILASLVASGVGTFAQEERPSAGISVRSQEFQVENASLLLNLQANTICVCL